jgi:hypothetical protein
MNIKEKDSKILRQTLDYYTLAHVITKRRNNGATSQTGKKKCLKCPQKVINLEYTFRKKGPSYREKSAIIQFHNLIYSNYE